MGKSRKKQPYCGFTKLTSEKKDKRLANRRLRTNVKNEIKQEKEILSVLREVSNVWSMAKDGKQRFDPEQHPNEMRK